MNDADDHVVAPDADGSDDAVTEIVATETEADAGDAGNALALAPWWRRPVVVTAIAAGAVLVLGGSTAAAFALNRSAEPRPASSESAAVDSDDDESDADDDQPLTVTAPEPRLTCAQLSPGQSWTLQQYDSFNPDEPSSIAVRQAGAITCGWERGLRTVTVDALPDAAAAFGRSTVDVPDTQYTVVDTVGDASRMWCMGEGGAFCAADVRVGSLWLRIGYYEIGITSPTPGRYLLDQFTAVAQSVAASADAASIGAPWSPHPDALDASAACGSAALLFGSASTLPPQGGSIYDAEYELGGWVSCMYGDYGISAVTSGGWVEWASDGSVVDGADRSWVECEHGGCTARMVIEGSVVIVVGASTDEASFLARVEEYVAELTA